MQVKPKKSGGMTAQGETVFGNYHIECDMHGKIDLDKSWMKPKPQGLGDTIANALKKVGIKPCGGCKERQAKLNAAVPYKKD